MFDLKYTNFKISGGLFGGLLGILLLILIFKEEKRNILNTVIEGMFLCGAAGKIRCFIDGCCLGIHTNLPWAVSYPEYGLYDLHPVQLYEVIVFLIGFMLLIELKDIMKDTSRISIAVLFYFTIRMFILEGIYGTFLGNKELRIIYIITMLVCVFFIIKDKKENVKYGKAKEE